MCGITGFYSLNNCFNDDDLKRMNAALQHRGPDADGFYSDGICSLGHRRLSIIDLDARANQPMHSHNQNYVMVYNGEVYNYKEIADKLKLTNLRTTSDTEIILEAFCKQPDDFVQHLNGMFAFAIYNKLQKELIIYRDRIGIKPLYYFWDGNNFAFGSELKALLQLNIKKEINFNAISYFLQTGFIPAPHSIYKNIFKLRSGHFLRVDKNGLKETEYWNVADKIEEQPESNFTSSINTLENLLHSSIEWQLRSDVPVGVFLSGGIDSSLITALTSKISTNKVATYSIGFNESTHDESQYARKVSQLLGTDHHEFKVTDKDAMDLIETLPDEFDEPFGDPSAVPTQLVSKLASQHVKVVLSGDGGDELFFGYGSYKWATRLHHPLIKTFHNPFSKVLQQLPVRYKRVGRLLNYKGTVPSPEHILSQEQYMFNPDEAFNLLKRTGCNSKIDFEKLQHTKRKLTPAEQQDLFDLRYYLQDDLLTKVDRASMKYSMEVRVPLLDHRLIEFAINLNPNLKLHNGESKYLLKQMLYKYLPKELFNRPKQGFSMPIGKWFSNELKPLLTTTLNKKNIDHYGILDSNEVQIILQEFNNGQHYHFNRLWQLMILNLWLKKFN